MATPPKGNGGKGKLPTMPKAGKAANFLPKQTTKTRKKAY